MIETNCRSLMTGIVLLSIWLPLASLADAPPRSSPGRTEEQPRIGVLLVSHGSRSVAWREALLALERSVRHRILEDGRIGEVRSAFMEYEGPSIADQMRAFDAAQYTDVIIVPVFLTVSPHPFDDLPTILGLKEDPGSLETLKIEKIERYTPVARTHITTVPDFPRLLEHNVLRRARALSKNPAEEGLVLIAYGDETYYTEWRALMDNVSGSVARQLRMKDHSWGWCGHLVHYDPDSTAAAITHVLRSAKRAVVVPALIAVDEMFQVRIIGDGIAKVDDAATRVAYRPDAILPDTGLGDWIVGAVRASLDRLLPAK